MNMDAILNASGFGGALVGLGILAGAVFVLWLIVYIGDALNQGN
jgi:hypothetical protein